MMAQMRIQSVSVERGLYLFGISFTDCCDDISVSQAALQHIRVLDSRLEDIYAEDFIRKICPVLYSRDIVDPLEAKVMDRQY